MKEEKVCVGVFSDLPVESAIYDVLASVYVKRSLLGQELGAVSVTGHCRRVWNGRRPPETVFEEVVNTAGKLGVCLFFYPYGARFRVTLPQFVVGECSIEELSKAIRLSAALGFDVGREYLIGVLKVAS